MNLIIYAHPSHEGHNGKTLKGVIKTLNSKKQKYHLIDLYKENFQSHFSKEEYDRIIKRDRTTDEDVKTYQKLIDKAENLIFIYPVWWYGMPAILKGFMDRVFTSGFAYRFKKTSKILVMGASIISFIPGIRYLLQPYSAIGKLKGKRAFIFRTYGGPKLGKRIFGNMPAGLEDAILRLCGITKIKLHELYSVDQSSFSQKTEERYLAKIKNILTKN